MISSHGTNKEGIRKNICDPTRYMVTSALDQLYSI